MKENRNLIIILIALTALLAGALGIFYVQNNMLLTQSQHQRMHIAEQAAMIDSLRRGDLANLMSNVLDKIDEELRKNPQRILSNESIDRIAALSYSFKPYARLQGDSLSSKKLSPERGQLLLMIATLDIDSTSLRKIMFKTSFEGADLRGADLSGLVLRGVNLKGSDLQDANLKGADLYEAVLMSANLWGANLSRANLNAADLKRAVLNWAVLNEAKMVRADLSEADMISAQLRKVDFREAILRWTILNGAFLNEANLTGADLYRTKLKRAQFIRTNLTNANLAFADLMEANLSEANLTGANLTDAIVAEMKWLERLMEWSVTGAGEFQTKYKMVDATSVGESQYYVKKK